MTDKPATAASDKPKRVSARGRQDGNYPAPIVTEPKGGPVPAHRPLDEPAAAEPGPPSDTSAA